MHETLALLDAYNEQIQSGASLGDLATPSEAACQHCPYKPVCDPFWNAALPGWDMRGSAHVEGIVTATEGFGSSGRALEIDAVRGNLSPGRYRLRGITPLQYSGINAVTPGTEVRVVGARNIKPDEPRDLLATDYTEIWWEQPGYIAHATITPL